MRLSYNWLKDYVDIKLSPEKLAELLTMAGLCVDSIHKKGDDAVLEIEITSNRPDWLSYIGVAREVAALTGKKLKIPSVSTLSAKKSTAKISVKVVDKKLCPRYTARIIRNVKVGES
ncbi:MAG: phenylalanine--tRNA ligase subunit beta, partial [Candidatus Omnitrophica bacterium]|nr:phenylalanine--tRNA ligase subunit beta [Candidatus Omnitrophota bacterium]